MKKLYLGLPVIVLLIVYFVYDPSKYSFFLRCPFRSLTGLDCPGCGSQRAVFRLLHGNLYGAIQQNLLLVASLPFLAVHGLYKGIGFIKNQDIRWKVIYHPLTPIVVGIITIAFFVMRNLEFYPFKH